MQQTILSMSFGDYDFIVVGGENKCANMLADPQAKSMLQPVPLDQPWLHALPTQKQDHQCSCSKQVAQTMTSHTVMLVKGTISGPEMV